MNNRSKNLSQLRDIALSITRDRRISVTYDENARTASIDLENLYIILSPNLIPKGMRKYPRMFQRCLDAECSHEAGHYLVTRPLESRYKRFESSRKYKKLAHLITNIVEDKRVNYFIEKRFRFDLGKRLKWFRAILKKSGEHAVNKYIDKYEGEIALHSSRAGIMVNMMIQTGLYDGKINDTLFKELTPTQRKDIKHILKLLDASRPTWIKHDLVELNSEIYGIIERHVDDEDKIPRLVHKSIEGGELELDLNLDLQDELEDEEQQEENEDDLNQGGGAGVSQGNSIPSPNANAPKYFGYVQRNSQIISSLLNKLKKFVKPVLVRKLFTKHGRLLAPIISRAYTNSIRRRVSRIYTKTTVEFEKQKIAIGFLVDFSGSMDFNVACDVVTTMNEVMGSWVDDESYSIIVFGGDYQKIKTFFESFHNTRARVGGISVDSSATMIASPLNDMRKMFQAINPEKQRVLVIASDFWFGDNDEAEEAIRNLVKEGVVMLFIGLCSGLSKLTDFCPNERNIFRTFCAELSDLPEFFVDTYMKSIGNIRK